MMFGAKMSEAKASGANMYGAKISRTKMPGTKMSVA